MQQIHHHELSITPDHPYKLHMLEVPNYQVEFLAKTRFPQATEFCLLLACKKNMHHELLQDNLPQLPPLQKTPYYLAILIIHKNHHLLSLLQYMNTSQKKIHLMSIL